MAKNKMKEVAKLLGVELNEDFIIKNRIGKYKFTNDDFLIRYKNERDYYLANRYTLLELLVGKVEAIKIPKEILSEKEKKYLSNVIRPYENKNKVESICKYRVSDSKERLSIYIKNDVGIDLPKFEKGTMFKGMELNKEYTLEDLGI